MTELYYPEKAEDIESVRFLMRAYATSMGLDLGFQGFEKELAELPGKYAPPYGYLLLAMVDGELAGCVAIRKLDDSTCEMKRMFVLLDYRGRGVGRLLAEAIIEKARDIGFSAMKLDTIASMKEAVRLYYALGFRETDAYTYNPSSEVIYLELAL